MADTTEMLRIIRHAADLLDAQDPWKNAETVANYASLPSVRAGAFDRARAESVAIAVASSVLRMVAACMDEEPTPAPFLALRPPPEVPA